MSRRRRPPVRRRPSVRSGTSTVSAGIDAVRHVVVDMLRGRGRRGADGSVAPAPRSALQACRYRGLLRLFCTAERRYLVSGACRSRPCSA